MYVFISADVTPQGQFEVQAVPSALMPASSSQPSGLEKSENQDCLNLYQQEKKY